MDFLDGLQQCNSVQELEIFTSFFPVPENLVPQVFERLPELTVNESDCEVRYLNKSVCFLSCEVCSKIVCRYF